MPIRYVVTRGFGAGLIGDAPIGTGGTIVTIRENITSVEVNPSTTIVTPTENITKVTVDDSTKLTITQPVTNVSISSLPSIVVKPQELVTKISVYSRLGLIPGSNDAAQYLIDGILVIDGNRDLLNIRDAYISGTLNATANAAIALATPRTFSLTGGVTGTSAPFDGTGNVSINATVNAGSVDHDSLLNFVSTEHIDHSSVTLSAGVGLSGGGDLTSNRTFSLDTLNTRNVDHSAISITAGSGLSGGGNLTASRNLALDLTNLTTETSIGAASLIPYSGGKNITFSNFESNLDIANMQSFNRVTTLESRVNDLDAAVILQGTFDPALLGAFPGGGTAQAGHSWIAISAATIDGQDIGVNDRVIALVDNASPTISSNWHVSNYTDVVQSVAGKTGAVTLVMSDITDAGALASLDSIPGVDVSVSGTFLGISATGTGTNPISIGANASAGGSGSIVIGDSAATIRTNAVVIGLNADVGGSGGVSIGANSSATHVGSISLGSGAAARGYNGDISIGQNSDAVGTVSGTALAIGNSAGALDANTIAIGRSSLVTHANSIAIGSQVTSTRDNETRIGSNNAVTVLPGTLYLGEQAVAEADILNYGQLWINSGDNELWFTKSDGTDINISVGPFSSTGIMALDTALGQSGDFIPFIDVSDSNILKKLDVADLLGGSGDRVNIETMPFGTNTKTLLANDPSIQIITPEANNKTIFLPDPSDVAGGFFTIINLASVGTGGVLTPDITVFYAGPPATYIKIYPGSKVTAISTGSGWTFTNVEFLLNDEFTSTYGSLLLGKTSTHRAGADDVVQIGNGNLGGDKSVCIGSGSSTSSLGVSIGYQVYSSSFSVSVGANINNSFTKAENNCVLVGYGISLSDTLQYSVLIGSNTAGEGFYNSLVGNDSIGQGFYNSLFGHGNIGQGNNIVTIGNRNSSSFNDTILIGRQLTSSRANETIIGSNNAVTRLPGTLYLVSQPAAEPDIASNGQIWVSSVDGELYYTKEDGTDIRLS